MELSWHFGVETLHSSSDKADMLQAMQQHVPVSPSTGPASFAVLLAALTSPAKKGLTAWRDKDLADDVATLSYERALRTHSLYKTADATDRSLTQPRKAERIRIFEATPDESDPKPFPEAAQPAALETETEAVPEVYPANDRNLKNASITIRLSWAECAQLRKRAAEAGLTVSAYMRSCTFETESLRALVKDTMAQMRTEPAPTGLEAVDSRRGLRGWFGHFWPHARVGQGIAQA